MLDSRFKDGVAKVKVEDQRFVGFGVKGSGGLGKVEEK